MAPSTIPARRLNQAVYVAVASARRDPVLDLVAGITAEMLRAHPAMSTAAIQEAVTALHSAATAARPDPEKDTALDDATRMMRVLVRVVPGLTGAELRDGARTYTRTFIAVCRPGAADKIRQVAPLELQFDQGGQVDAFRGATWEKLHTAATARATARQAVDQGPIGAALGFTTRMSAAELLDRVPVEPLAGFVRVGLQPNGTLLLDLAAVDPVIANAGARMTELRDGYVANLLAVNTAEQRARDAVVGPVRSESDVILALIAVINETKEKQKTLDEKIGGVKEGVGGTIGLLAFLAKGLDDGLAADLAEFGTIAVTMLDGMQKAAKGALAAAEVLAGMEKVSADLVIAGTGVGLAFVVVAVIIQVTGLLGKSESIEQVILEELRKIGRQITELRDEMHIRFDRIDRKLDLMYIGLLDRLADIDFTLGEVRGDVEAIQRGLYDLSGELQRLNRDVHAFLEAGNRRDLVETINGFLDFVELTGEPLDFAGFRTAENVFFSWGRDHAKDALQAGPTDRDFGEDDVFRELTALPLSTNVNYLREAPAALFGLAPLAPDRLANPFDWIVASEAYAQLSEESPDHAARISPTRVDDLIAVGEALGTGLSESGKMTLLCQVIGKYQQVFTRLKATIGGAAGTFLGDPNNRLFGVDPWGAPDQLPGKNFLTDRYGDLSRCDGQRFDPRNPTVPRDPVTFDRAQTDALRPFLIADNLSTSQIPDVASGLKQISVCVDAKWNLVTLDDVPLGGLNLVSAGYRLSISANVRYGTSTILRNEYDTGEKFQITLKRDEVGAFDPVTDRRGRNPYPLFMNLSDPDDPQSQGKFWQKLGTYRISRSTADSALRRTVLDEVRRKLVLVQRGLYNEIARRFTAEGDEKIQGLGRRLTGVKLLMQAFVTAGLPLSTEADDLLRSLLFGSEAILGGVPESGGAALDNVRDIYLFFANRQEDPPAADILPDVQKIADDRMNALATALLEITSPIDRGEAPPQAPELFAPTLLRLGLLRD